MRRTLLALFPLVVLSTLPANALACSETSASPLTQALRTDHYITDTILHRRWAVVMDCRHPERPWTLREVVWEKKASAVTVRKTETEKSGHGRQLIPAGAKVRIWRNAGGASIELSGIALDTADLGQTIHVRTGPRGTVLEGKVSGAGSVELSALAKWQSGLRAQ